METRASQSDRMEGVSLLHKATITEIGAFGIGSLYFIGYYIDSVFLGNLGILHAELARLEYIKIGFAFCLVVCGFIVIPVGSVFLTHKVRKTTGLPSQLAGTIGNALNTTIVLGQTLFFALFFTRYEWDLMLPKPLFGIGDVKGLIYLSIVTSAFGMAIVPVLERLLMMHVAASTRLNDLFRFIVDPLRFAMSAVSLITLYLALSPFAWVFSLLQSGFTFLLITIACAAAMAAWWIKGVHRIRGSWPVYALIALGVCAVFYFLVTTYVLGVYTYLPINRGGRLPLTRSHIQFRKDTPPFQSQGVKVGTGVAGPFYVVEETSEELFVTAGSIDKWTSGFVGVIFIKKDDIVRRHISRIEDGYPRVVKHLRR